MARATSSAPGNPALGGQQPRHEQNGLLGDREHCGIVRKQQRRLDGIDSPVLSLSARGLTTGEIAAHFEEV